MNTDVAVSSKHVRVLMQHWRPERVSVKTKTSEMVEQILCFESKSRTNYLADIRNQYNTTRLGRSNILVERTTSICLLRDPCTKLRRKHWVLGGRPAKSNIQIDFLLRPRLNIHLYKYRYSEYFIRNWEPTIPQIHFLVRRTSSPESDPMLWGKWKHCLDKSQEKKQGWL